MATNDDDGDYSSNVFSEFGRNDNERDLYAILLINKDVRKKQIIVFVFLFSLVKNTIFRLMQRQFNKHIVD